MNTTNHESAAAKLAQFIASVNDDTAQVHSIRYPTAEVGLDDGAQLVIRYLANGGIQEACFIFAGTRIDLADAELQALAIRF